MPWTVPFPPREWSHLEQLATRLLLALLLGMGLPEVAAAQTTGMVQIVRFQANPDRIRPGQQSTLGWQVLNADVVTITEIGTVPSSGSRIVSPTRTTTWVLTGRNSIGERSATTTVVVEDVPSVIRLYVGRMSLSEYAKVSSLPLPTVPNQKFCNTIRLAPDMLAWAYVPTPAERTGDFSNSGGGALLDPLTNAPFPGNRIPANRLADPFAWRIAAAGPAPGEACLSAPSVPQFSSSYYVTGLNRDTDRLFVTPSSVSAGYEIGSTPPPVQNVTVVSVGQPLDFLVEAPTEPTTWLSVIPQGPCCRTPGMVQLGFQPLGLRAGFYFPSIAITPIGAIGTPFMIGIRFTVTAPPQWITVDRPVLQFTARPGQPPMDQFVNINAPAGRAYDVRLRVVSPAGVVWAGVGSTSGEGPGPLRISILQGALPGLGPGTYLALIDIVGRPQARFSSAAERHTDATTCGGAVDQERIAVILAVSPELGLTASLPGPALGWTFLNGAAQVSYRTGDATPANGVIAFDRNIGTNPNQTTGAYNVLTEVRNPTSLNWLAALPTSINGIPNSITASLNSLGLSQLVPCQYDGYLAISRMGTGLVVPIGMTVTPGDPLGRPVIRATQGVLQVFSNSTGVSSGTWLSVYGSDFSTVSGRTWEFPDFTGNRGPTQLGGVSVMVNNQPAYIIYVDRGEGNNPARPAQINFQVPDGTTGPVQIEVVGPGGTSDPVTVTKTSASPALYTHPSFVAGGRQYAGALHADLKTFVGPPNLAPGLEFRPTMRDQQIVLYAVGCGPTVPASPAGHYFLEARSLASPFQVRFNNTINAPQASGALAASIVGLCQFNVTVPRQVPDGDVRIDVTVDGISTGQTLYTFVLGGPTQ